MKRFFKIFFACLLAMVVFCILIFFFFAGLLGGIMSNTERTVSYDEAVLEISLKAPIREQSYLDPVNAILKQNNFKIQGLHDLIRGIKKAEKDSEIKGIYLKLNGNSNLYATNEELRRALLDFKKSGKFIIAYGDVITQKDYYIASVADKVFLNPVGALDFSGFSMTTIFFKGAMDKLGIQANVFYDGKFKSATEPFRTTHMTEANKLQTKAYLNSLYGHFLSGISEQRHLDTAILFKYANQGLVQSAKDALDYGLVDGLEYPDEVKDVMKKKMGLSGKEDIDFISWSDYSANQHLKKQHRKKIAILYAQGNIINNGSKSAKPQIVGRKYVKLFKKIREDSSIKAVVFRVNSPGGSALASDKIWRALMLTKQIKPVVVSMGDYAASGGYYISCAANEIFTEANTLTGSIGVFGIVPDLTHFFKNKLGVTFDGVKTAEYADMGSAVRPMTAAEKKMMQNNVDRIYETFKDRVSKGRMLSEVTVDSIAQGRVWSGADAVRLGLADSIGGMPAAIDAAARLADLSKYSLKEFPAAEEPYEKILQSVKGDIQSSVIEKKLGAYFPIFKQMKELKKPSGKVMARLPFVLYK